MREKQAQTVQTPFRTPSPPPFPLLQQTPQGPASAVKYGQKLQRAYANLKPGEKIDSEQIQRFIRGSIASGHTLELTARDLKAIQEATTARAKRASLGGQVAQKGGTIKVSECRALYSKRKEKEEEQSRKKKRGKKSGQKRKRILSWLELNFLLEEFHQ